MGICLISFHTKVLKVLNSERISALKIFALAMDLDQPVKFPTDLFRLRGLISVIRR